MRIMYIEDNPANLFLVKRVARMGNHDVINYIDGQTALEKFESDNPDLVLIDIQLSGELSGLDVVKKLRKQGHKTPVVAVTAYAMVGDRERCLDAGCDDYLAKPLPVPALVDLIKRYEGDSGERGAAAPATPAEDKAETKSETPKVEATAETAATTVATSAEKQPAAPPDSAGSGEAKAEKSAEAVAKTEEIPVAAEDVEQKSEAKTDKTPDAAKSS